MIDRCTIFEIHRLADSGLSRRQIALKLRLDRKTVRQYLDNPDLRPKARKKQPSKLDPYLDNIAEIIKEWPDIKGTVALQRLKAQGFTGGITIVRDYLRETQGKKRGKEPFIRFESEPGQQMQIDWGHFGSLSYENGSRKLYCLAVIEGHSRMLYVHFTHSQKQEALHQALIAAFKYFGGSPKEVVVDNMLTAVTERVGSIIRFNERFLDFLRIFKITPIACNVRAPYEKGKVENAIKYIRNNFWPLREFKDLDNVQAQVMGWLRDIANVRKHQTTNEMPVDRIQTDVLARLPTLPDCRETLTLKVYKDFGVRFDCMSIRHRPGPSVRIFYP
ncbi:IS21 family transposase [Desulfobacterota bacterium M19]